MSETKIAIVTGANNGIGFETAIGMAKAGYHTVLACRSEAKGKAAMAEMQKRVPGGEFALLLLDLSDFESVRHFATAFRQHYDRLDVLINNAGVLDYSGRKASNGYELQLMTNHLGHMLLTSLLLDRMPDAPESRIVSLSSVAHRGARIHFDDIHCENTEGVAAYSQSKLACLLFGDELNRRLQAAGRQVLSLSVHPGGSDSGLFDDMSRLQYYTMKILAPFIIHNNASAAKPSLHAALSPDAKGGDFYGPQGFKELRGKAGKAVRDASAQDPAVANRLWEVSEKLIGEPFRLG
ncbi:oxidoreductase [Alterisphingorhabdus coralli]|uniref:Oxidoreductase n=1 Tax=Alterisphingorhabdus coralli TaxID=3071408 RepID=A0AA97F876_9SPHN|nr:oxidoreductase [Parasphingorhabdus sp. SCSIO 66989]WOE75082.1 oxidoreductase [Parasphingorhabdus sp. SCSIO 66989]